MQDSLGGNYNTFIITNISENLDYIEETKNTLKFAENASHVKLNLILIKDSNQGKTKPYKCIRLRYREKTLKWNIVPKKYIKYEE